MPNYSIEFIELKNKCRSKSAVQTIMTRAKTSGYICELCGNGSGETGTGIERNGDRPAGVVADLLRCRKCGFEGDLIEYIKQLQKLDTLGAVNHIAKAIGENTMTLKEIYNNNGTQQPRKSRIIDITEIRQPEGVIEPKKPKEYPDSTELYKQYYRNLFDKNYGIDGREYLYNRGIRAETMRKYWIGFCKNWKYPNSQSNWKSNVIIIPKSAESYLARTIDSPFYKDKFPKKIVGRKDVIFNKKNALESLISGEYYGVIATEGEFDALTLLQEMGYNTPIISIGSTNWIKNIYEPLKELYREYYKRFCNPDINQEKRKFLICTIFDDDGAGDTATKQIQDFFVGLDCVEVADFRKDILIAGNDINETYINCLKSEELMQEWKRKAEEIRLKITVPF